MSCLFTSTFNILVCESHYAIKTLLNFLLKECFHLTDAYPGGCKWKLCSGSLSCCRDSGVTVVGVYRQLYQHCSEPLEHMAPVDRALWDRARETVQIYGGERDGARARVVWTQLYTVYRTLSRGMQA
jgi:hypothetical protein